MTWLERADGEQRTVVNGQCAECEALWVARDVAQLDADAVKLALAVRRLTTHMRDVIHMDAPRARRDYSSDYDPERPWGSLTRSAGRPALPSLAIGGYVTAH